MSIALNVLKLSNKLNILLWLKHRIKSIFSRLFILSVRYQSRAHAFTEEMLVSRIPCNNSIFQCSEISLLMSDIPSAKKRILT